MKIVTLYWERLTFFPTTVSNYIKLKNWIGFPRPKKWVKTTRHIEVFWKSDETFFRVFDKAFQTIYLITLEKFKAKVHQTSS